MAATAQQRIKCTIHVSSLPPEATKELLMAAFIPFGEIADIQIPRNEDGKDPVRRRISSLLPQTNELDR
jgi:RNA recognition motif-containing protein